MSTIKDKEDLTYVLNSTDLIPVSDNGGLGLGKGVTAKQIGDAIGPRAVLDAWSNTPQLYASPIAGDPDVSLQLGMSQITHIATGFLQPKAGILDGIEAIFQGSTGGGANENLRLSICSVKTSVTTPTGLAIDQVLWTNLVPVANNASGRVILSTGMALAVPPQFIVTIKGEITALSAIQNCFSGGPVPGVRATISAGGEFVSAATYATGTVELSIDPPIPGDNLTVIGYKALSMAINWQGE